MTTHDIPAPLGDFAAALAEHQWSPWFPFARSSNVRQARYLGAGGVWEVEFGGKPYPPRTDGSVRPGLTPVARYRYADPRLTPAAYHQWVAQYAAGGSAGIWLDLHVKRNGITGAKVPGD